MGLTVDVDTLPRLFKQFVCSGKSWDNGLGNSLSQAIVSWIVKAHHGSVITESANNRTIFR
ncbi:ATP-binding protein [Mycobacterium leprae]|uniref:ATP-binding protein n=1 Tax=Mycobacterium leprae TaxID=1769 RepID=A0AAD0P753_MYCLR|nr:ATP-binding protein [Mycobacterium leprae]OAR21386.1 hypothetical protein A8144_06180 [Mycobacterium leprae 3125609]OAX71584.1 hypothetical protein A3216_04625 [Mycobacterium leprae 7935681]